MKTSDGERLPVDIDVSVMVNDDCRKEGVEFTYHRIDGNVPLQAKPFPSGRPPGTGTLAPKHPPTASRRCFETHETMRNALTDAFGG